ncbi:MAG: DUF5309 family protein [Kiritimatiellae bacterium]|nr:DUF5309 family protein [Kiritimatiellia bacterium]
MAYFTVSRELVDPDYHDGVVASHREDLLFQNLVGRIKGQPVDWEQKVQVKAFPKARDAAVAEGVDFDRSQVKEYTDFVLGHVMEIFRSEGYRVTRHREKMPGHNDRRGMTRAQKQALDAQNLALSVEVAALSEQEAVEYGTTKKPIMRGAACWLKPKGSATAATDVHAVYPIPLDLVPTAGYEGNVASLTEALFKAEMVKAKKQRGTGNLSLVGVVGIDLKAIMSGWLAAATNINSGNIQRQQPADKKALQLICDDFVFDGVKCHVMNDDHVMNDVVGANATWGATEASYKSGIFIDPTMWGFATLSPMEHFNIVDEGGGPGGWHETTLRLTCLNPMGQFRVKHAV